MKEINKIKQKSLQDYFISKLGTSQWIRVFETSPNSQELDIAILSSLVPSNKVNELLSTYEWDIDQGFGRPSISIRYPEGNVQYSRFGDKKGIEPLVIKQSFFGIKEPDLNISEEFRLFHNLFWNDGEKVYQAISDCGDTEDIVRFIDHSIEIKLKSLKQFCAFKNMSLAIYFDVFYFSEYDLNELKLKPDSIEKKGADYFFSIYWTEYNITHNNFKSLSRFLGKKFIQPMPIEKTGIWPFESIKQYEDFIIGIDGNGVEKKYTCNPESLTISYSSNKDEVSYLQPIFFTKEVLKKYYDFPEKFVVQDGFLSCGNLWQLQIDNNHEKYIIVYLGDLGKLPENEQKYWKSYNISPDGRISQVAFKRDFKAEFTEPIATDLIFKKVYKKTNRMWKQSFGWQFFLPLSIKDDFHFSSIHIPLSPSQKEFDEQILSLTKILIDSINESEIDKSVTIKEIQSGSIRKLETYLAELNYPDPKNHIDFLINLQSLRSTGIAHRKGKNYTKPWKYFGLNEKDTKTVFIEILQKANLFLEYLQNLCKI